MSIFTSPEGKLPTFLTAGQSRRRRIAVRLAGALVAVATAASLMLGLNPATEVPAANATVCGTMDVCYTMNSAQQASFNAWANGTWPLIGTIPAWPTLGGVYVTEEDAFGNITREIQGGRQYNDNDGQLRNWFIANTDPGTDFTRLAFYEYDVNDHAITSSRDANRFVRAVNPAYPGNEVTFITVDHYANFYRVD